MSSDKLYTINLEGMEFHAFHGCYALERISGSHFEVNLKITTPIGDVAKRDDVTLAVNYLNVYQIVKVQMATTKHTIESVAQSIIDALHQNFEQIVGIECSVTKLAPPLGGKVRRVSVTLVGDFRD